MEPLPSWKTFALELLLYATLLVAYFAFVLHYLGGWFKDLYDHDRNLFAVMALVIMIGQTVVLETVSSFLIWFLRVKKKRKK
jgi:Kef-type K+ transport system membrane component KefB